MKHIFTFCVLLLPGVIFAQTRTANAGWFVLSNSTKLTEKINAFADVQLRTSNGWTFLRQVEVSTGINFNISDNHEIGFGGVLTNTKESPTGSLTEKDNRVFEQYVLKHRLWNAAVNHRFRLEQRFMETAVDHPFFAQRFRYRLKFQQPLSNRLIKFDKGFYVLVLNEVLLNVQNQGKVNNHLLDQNRLLLAMGYRLSKNLDIDCGYLNNFAVGKLANGYTNIAQIALTTRF